MDLSGPHLYITPNELDAGLLANKQRTFNAACRLKNFVLHNGEWHFRLDAAHLDEFKEGLEATVAMTAPNPDQSKLRFKQGQRIGAEVLEQLAVNNG